MQVLKVELGERSYPVIIGSGLLSKADSYQAILPARKVALVTNEVVAPLYLDAAVAALQELGVEVVSIVLPDGEAFKNWQTLNGIFDKLLSMHCDRGTTVVALGGGVIGDMAGFAAAVYQRGVRFVQVPTTLLAQVDSSVGGKTAINHPLGKNMIGAFHQPCLVVADTETLSTLPDRELSAGLAEVIKYGLIRDRDFFCWLEVNMDRLRARDAAALAHAIERSCANKADVVAEDETEQGVRALLNLGHTFGHAIETGVGYGEWLHGEAVAAGTVMAATLSNRLGWLSGDALARTKSLLGRAGLPLVAPSLGADRYLDLMSHDKKVLDGALRLVLLKDIGEGVLSSDAPVHEIAAAIDLWCR
jgi:3-dehydroquinate synthase